MKNKKILFTIVVFTILTSCLLILGYKKVNNKFAERGVQETLVKPNQLVKTKNVDFMVKKTEITKNTNQVKVYITLALRLKHKSDFGFHKNNNNFYENTWLNIPYGLSSPTERAWDQNGKKLTQREIDRFKQQNVKIEFDTTKTEIKNKNAPVRFSFLIPNKQYYEKYSMLIPDL